MPNRREPLYPATFKYDLGDKVVDRVTKLTGIITGRLDSLNGCNRYSVQPESEDGVKLPESYWIDEHAVDLKEANVHVPFRSVVKSGERTGTNGPLMEKVVR
jgi:hypothetical protein